MTIRIEVSSVGGRRTAGDLAAEFSDNGGTIGRAQGNTLVLPDELKTVSRTHATIEVRNGQYVLRDVGSATAILVNGRQLGNGREAPIKIGDQLVIGEFLLAVRAGSQDVTRDRATLASAGGPSQPKDDPLATLGSQSSAAADDDPFADLIPAAKRAAGSPGGAQQNDDSRLPPLFIEGARSKHSAMPDQDPFADLGVGLDGRAQDQPQDKRSREQLGIELGPSSAAGQSIDQLFALDAPGLGDPFGKDHPLGEPSSNMTPVSKMDPLAALDQTPPVRPSATQRDDLPELQAGFIPPRSVRSQQPGGGINLAKTHNVHSQLVSWDGVDGPRAGEVKSMVFGSPSSAQPHTDESSVISRDVSPSPKQEDSIRDARGHAVERGNRHSSQQELLLRAFLEGAGVPDLDVRVELSPQLMKMFGQLLREAVKGTLDLLATRSIAKREIRAEVSVIVAKDNNPLKFSPSAEAAMSHLLAPQGRGFMTPLRAMRNAYDDLRAHELAMMAGMRAALMGMLDRFDPHELERRFESRGFLDAVLPMNRRARLWDKFEELFGEISEEAREDFHSLFGRAFLKAYEEQLDQIERDR